MDHAGSLPNNPTGPVGASWLVSFLLHAGLVVTAVVFVQRMQLVPQTNPFQWDVAMVTPLSPPAEATPLAEPTGPPTPTVQRTPATTSIHRSVPSVEPVMKRSAASVTTRSSAESSQEHLLHAEPNSSSPAPTLSTDSPPDIAAEQLLAISSEEDTPTRDPVTAPVDSQTTTDSSSASFAATSQLRSAKADYGWLAAIMAQWIKDLNKRYPAMLRTEGMQGKVMLAAILHEDGLLSDVRIVKSSGHAALDQVAVEDVRNGPPVHLSHPLDRAQMPVRFSISYDLKTAR